MRQLDGACVDDRFNSDFFIDFIFEPIDAEQASKMLVKNSDESDETKLNKVSSTTTTVDSKQESVRKAVQASAEDSMLYGDSRFWDVISNRMKQNASNTTIPNDDPMFGPTVGRRRDLESNNNDPNNDMKSSTSTISTNSDRQKQQNPNSVLGAFSIGGEMDFLPAHVGSESAQMQNIDSPAPKSKKSIASTIVEPKKDSLLEALMGALDDNHDEIDHNDDEIVVEFDADKGDGKATESVVASDNETLHAHKLETNVNETPEIVPRNLAEKAVFSPTSEVSSTGKGTLDFVDTNDDIDALLAGIATTNIMDGLTDADLLNLDIDDAELDDLESFLSK
jgi:hypothetical protein